MFNIAGGFNIGVAFSITDVDTDNILVDGQTGFSIATAGFANDITTVNLKVGTDRVALTNLSGTGDSYTADLMDVTALTSDTVGLPFSSATYQNEIEVTDGTDTAVINITRNPKAGWEVVETLNAVVTEGSGAETRPEGAPSDLSQIYYPTAQNTAFAPTFIVTSDADIVEGKLWDVDTSTWEAFTITFVSGDGNLYVKPIVRFITRNIVQSVVNVIDT